MLHVNWKYFLMRYGFRVSLGDWAGVRQSGVNERGAIIPLLGNVRPHLPISTQHRDVVIGMQLRTHRITMLWLIQDERHDVWEVKLTKALPNSNSSLEANLEFAQLRFNKPCHDRGYEDVGNVGFAHR
jgi:hypothetical protein